MPIPDRPPNTHRFHTNKSEFTIDTPVIGSVPIRPTIILSSIFTKFVMPFCSMIGSAIIIVCRTNSFSNMDLNIFMLFSDGLPFLCKIYRLNPQFQVYLM